MGERSNSDPTDQSSQEKSRQKIPAKTGEDRISTREHTPSVLVRVGAQPLLFSRQGHSWLKVHTYPRSRPPWFRFPDRSPGRLQRLGRNRASGNGNANRLRPNPCAGTPTSMLFLSALKRGAGRRNLGNDGRGLVS